MKLGIRKYNKMKTRNLIIDTYYYTSKEIEDLFGNKKVWFFNDENEICENYNEFVYNKHELRINIDNFINGTIDFIIDDFGSLTKVAITKGGHIYYIR